MSKRFRLSSLPYLQRQGNIWFFRRRDHKGGEFLRSLGSDTAAVEANWTLAMAAYHKLFKLLDDAPASVRYKGVRDRLPLSRDLLRAVRPVMAPDLRAALLLCVWTGMRAGECLFLPTEAIKRIDGRAVIHVYPTPLRRLKNKQSQRLVPLAIASERGALWRAVSEGEYEREAPLFGTLHERTGREQSRTGGLVQNVSSRFRRACVKVGVRDPAMTWHSSRHLWRSAARLADVHAEATYSVARKNERSQASHHRKGDGRMALGENVRRFISAVLGETIRLQGTWCGLELQGNSGYKV